MKKANKKLILSIVCILIVVGVFFFIKNGRAKKVSMLSDTVEEEVSKIVELSTIKYNYTDVISYKNNKTFRGMNVPFTKKSFLIKYSGYIKAGIDLESVEVHVKDKDSIEIKLDKPKILDNVINEEDVYVYDEKESVFNKLKIEDLYDVLVKEKKKTEKEIVEKGFLNEAEKNGQDMLKPFLQNMGFEEIKIIFK